MRNFEQRIAEIDRRSKKIVEARRQRRKHILMACIPLVLCTALASAFGLSAERFEKTGAPAATDAALGAIEENLNESFICPIAKITVSGSDFSRTYSDIPDILLISGQLYAYGTRGSEVSGSANDGAADEGENRKESADDTLESVADSAGTGCTITLFMREGENNEYYLTGNTLKNLTANQSYTLSQTQVNELNDLLGIPYQ